MDRNHVPKRIGQGKAIIPLFLSALLRMIFAALSASMKKGIGQVFLSVMRERIKPGQMTFTSIPSGRSMPRRAMLHVFTHAFDAE